MKNRRIFKILMSALVLVFSLSFLFTNVDVVPTMAGASRVYVTSPASVRGATINGGDFMIEGGVYASDSKAVFDASASKTAKLLAKTKINNFKSYGVSRLMEMDITINITKIVEGGQVAVAIGLNSSRNTVGSADSAAIIFTYNQTERAIEVAINEYKANNQATALVAKHTYSMFSLNSDMKLTANIDVNNKAYIALSSPEAGIGATPILSGRTFSIDPTGYVAFVSQSTDAAKNEFRLSDMSITAYAYEVVETVDHYIETFDRNSYNANMFYSQSTGGALAPSKIYVENGQLVFRNVGQGYFTTREKYSNFELKFDVTDLYREGVKDEEGNILKLISHWFMVGFGVDNYNDPPSERAAATYFHFEGITGHHPTAPSNHFTGEANIKHRYVLWDNGGAAHVEYMPYPAKVDAGKFSLWDNDYVKDETVNLKFTMIDGVFCYYAKLASQSEYVLQYTYDLGTTQTGCIRIYTYGASAIPEMGIEYTDVLNMTIDNFEITNLDNEAVKQVKAAPVYKSNVQPATKDFNYTTKPDASDLLNNKLKK